MTIISILIAFTLCHFVRELRHLRRFSDYIGQQVKKYHLQPKNITSKKSSMFICLAELPKVQGSFLNLMLTL